jgi:hypothetical protein
MAASVPCPFASGAKVYTRQPLKIPPIAERKRRIIRLKCVWVGRGRWPVTGYKIHEVMGTQLT